MTSGLILYASVVANDTELAVEAERNFAKFIAEHADAPGIDRLAGALHSDPAPDDDSQSSWLRALFPAYLADFYGRESEFGPLLGGIRLNGVDSPEFSLRGSLESLRAPALVIAGRHDPICGPRRATELHEGIPGPSLSCSRKADTSRT
jgi:proline iminopeptidase